MITPSFSITATERVLPRLALDWTTGLAQSGVDVARAGVATYVDSDGLIKLASANTQRLDWSTGTAGLLVEEARINSLLYSEQFENISWVKINATITENVVVAPDGASTADKLVENTSAGTHRIDRSFVFSATAYTASIYLKAAERSWALVRFGPSALNINAYFNLSTGSTGTVGAGVTNATIKPVGNGWYRCSISGTSTIATDFGLIVFTATGNGVVSYTGDGVSGIYLWGAQLEAGAFPTSYIPTEALAVTRNADVATMTGTNFSDWYNPTEGSLYAEGSHQIAAGLNLVIAEIGDGTANNLIELYGTNNGQGNAYIASGGSVSATIAVNSTFPSNTNGKVIVGFKQNSFQIAGNGALGTSDASGNMPVSPTALYIGRFGGNSAYWNGVIKKIMYWPQRLTNAELQAFSK
jgi:hypothetical protein